MRIRNASIWEHTNVVVVITANFCGPKRHTFYQMVILTKPNTSPIARQWVLCIWWPVYVVAIMSSRLNVSFGNACMTMYKPLREGGVILCPFLEDMEHGIHNKDPHSVRFFALERIHTDVRGGDWDNLILQREARWIHCLAPTQPPGLNDTISYKPFL